MPPSRRHVSQAEREASRERILRVKPWLRSTGPRTAAGKARSSRNALQHGYYGAEGREARRLIQTLARRLGIESGEGSP